MDLGGRGYSVQINLLGFVNHIQESYKYGKLVDALHTDFPKAFDKVNHKILLFKFN